MDEVLRSKLNALAQKQADIKSQLDQLGKDSKGIDRDLHDIFQSQKGEAAPKVVNFEKITEAVIAQRPKVAEVDARPVTPPKMPSTAPKSEGGKTNEPSSSGTTGDLVVDPKSLQKKEKPKKSAGEWEINFGRIWLVRIGVLLLLTGLIFLSTYAYKNWLFHTGAPVKVSFFMLISLSLAGLGLWLEKKRKRFQQYGRVLAAGGLSAGYYTLYATYFTPSLKLIDSPILAGILLTLWAGGMLAFSAWKRSRIVAVMSIGLAFYGTMVNPDGWLSLFSALLLSSAGIWLMVKFKWVYVGLGTMLAAYLAHAFWLGGAYSQEVSEAVSYTYLACYWVLFTVALAMPQMKEIPSKIQCVFCGLNNLVAWQLVVFLIPDFIPHAEIGWISIGISGLLLVLAVLTHRGKWWSRDLVPIFAYQGILLLSLGILIEATGYTRFLLLAVQACLLVSRASYSESKLLRAMSGCLLLVALLTALPSTEQDHGIAAWPSYAALALVTAVYTALLNRDIRNATTVWAGNVDLGKRLTLLPAFATWIILGCGVFYQWSPNPGINGLWVSSIVIMLVYFFTKKPAWLNEVALTSTLAALAGFVLVILQTPLEVETAIIPIFGAATFWYMSPRITYAWDELLEGETEQGKPSTQLYDWLFSLSFWALISTLLYHQLDTPEYWMIVGGALALAGHAVGEVTRRRSIAVPAFIFHICALVMLITHGADFLILGWAPAVMMLAHMALVDLRWTIFTRVKSFTLLSLGLLAAVVIHSFQVFDRPEFSIMFLGLGLLRWAWKRQDHTFAMIGGITPLCISCFTALCMHGGQDWLRYIPVATSLVIHGILWFKTQNDKEWRSIRSPLLISGLICLVSICSLHTITSFDGSGLAICWGLLAGVLFSIGLILRCRPYRLVGLFLLAASVLHVLFIDVMKLDSLGRILSFITLGLVLLVLGFLYNRFQETIRKFL